MIKCPSIRGNFWENVGGKVNDKTRRKPKLRLHFFADYQLTRWEAAFLRLWNLMRPWGRNPQLFEPADTNLAGEIYLHPTYTTEYHIQTLFDNKTELYYPKWQH